MESVWLECETLEAATELRHALNQIQGVEALEPLLKGGQLDGRLIVALVIAAGIGAAPIAAVIVGTLSNLGYDHIKMGGKLTALGMVSIEASIDAARPASEQNRN